MKMKKQGQGRTNLKQEVGKMSERPKKKKSHQIASQKERKKRENWEGILLKEDVRKRTSAYVCLWGKTHRNRCLAEDETNE